VKVRRSARRRVHNFTGRRHAKNASRPEMAGICLLLESTILEMTLAYVERACVKMKVRRVSYKKVV